MGIRAKHLLGLALSIVILFGSIASLVFAQNDVAAQAVNTQTVEQQIIAYANSINFADADDGAAWALAKHGVIGGGQQMNAGGSHALTATLMNSKLAQTSIIRGCTMGIETMQRLGLPFAYVNAGCNWNSQGLTYRTAGYSSETAISKKLLFSVKSAEYTGKTNGYDESLIWMTGETSVRLEITRQTVSADTATYEVKVVFKDRFDFNKGDHTAPEQFASMLGSALFKEFDWVATTKFQVSVPNECTHRSYNYHLRYDPEGEQVISDISDVFSENKAEQKNYQGSTKEITYYQLERTIHLKHDRPWVLEYTVTNPKTLAFSEVELNGKDYTNLVSGSRSYLFFYLQKDIDTDDPYTAYCGLRLSQLFKYNSKDSYTLRLENKPGSGGNVIYLTVHNNTKAQTVLEPTAMDDYYLRVDGTYVLQDDQSKELSGKDLAIGYLGNRSYSFAPPAFEMKVWENGVTGAQTDYYETKTVQPTCTAKGYTQYTCSLCGYAYKNQYVNAKGHTFGLWEETQKQDCTTEGISQRQCTVCKQTQTQTTQALGHSVAIDPSEAPTCTQTGLTEGQHCTVCDEILVPQTQVSALGHDIGDWVTLKAVDCVVDGERQRSCARCDYVEIEVLKAPGHSVVTDPEKAPTCTESGLTEGSHCQVCAEIFAPQQTVAALGHGMEQWTVSKEMTCTEDGAQQRGCSRCDYIEHQTLKAPGHTVVSDAASAPTCTQIGLTAGEHCGVCGEILISQTQLPALGHDMGAWVVVQPAACAADGQQKRTCSRCDRIETQVLRAFGHTAVNDAESAPTCTQTGLTAGQHCSVCETVFIPQQIVPELGHQMGDWEVLKAETCTQDGEEQRQCIRCVYTQTQVRKAPGHQYKTAVIFPTCTDGGYTSHTCLCGDAYYDGHVAPMGHHYISTVVDPTYTKAGYTEHECNLCGDLWYDCYTAALRLPIPELTVEGDLQTGGGMLRWQHDGEADAYEVYYATSAKGKYTLCLRTCDAAAAVSVPTGKTYNYKVKAVCDEDASVNSDYSVSVKVTGKCPQPALTVKADTATGNPVLRWEKIAGAKKYEIYRATSENGSYKKIKTTTAVSYADTSAKVGATYYYKIKAVASKSSFSSGYSRIQACLCRCAQPKVSVKLETAGGKPSLSWKAITGAKEYRVYRSDRADGVFTQMAVLAKLSYTDRTAEPETEYWYKVEAVGADAPCNSEHSAAVHIRAALAKPEVTFFVDALTGKPALQWAAVEGAQTYEIYRSTKATKSYKKVAVVTDLSYEDLSAAVSKGYYYKVIAVGQQTRSAYSDYKKLTAKCAQPDMVVQTDSRSGKPVIRWEKVAGAKKYEIYRATSENGSYKKIKTTAAVSYTDTAAKVGATYYYKVKAVASKSSFNSVYSQTAVCFATCAQPVVTINNVRPSGKPGLSWKSISGAVEYAVYCVEEDGQYRLLSRQKGYTYTDAAAIVDGVYTYVVQAVGSTSATDSALSVPVTAIAACAAPTVRAQYSGNKPNVSWESVDGAIRYEVYRSTKSGSGYKKIATVESDTAYTDTAAKKGTTYYYKVVAVSAQAASADSAWVKCKSK